MQAQKTFLWRFLIFERTSGSSLLSQIAICWWFCRYLVGYFMASLMTLRRCQNFRSLEKYIGPLSPLSLSHFLSSPSLNCCSLNTNLFLGNFLFPFDLFFLRPEIPRNSTNRSSLMSAAARFASNAAPAKKNTFSANFFHVNHSHSLPLSLSHSLPLSLTHSLAQSIHLS